MEESFQASLDCEKMLLVRINNACNTSLTTLKVTHCRDIANEVSDFFSSLGYKVPKPRQQIMEEGELFIGRVLGTNAFHPAQYEWIDMDAALFAELLQGTDIKVVLYTPPVRPYRVYDDFLAVICWKNDLTEQVHSPLIFK
jgi:hypothetical protein